ncbi:MAG TPA: YkvA family protein [Hyphomicrobiales bacterium]|nr:YkvA family protein [Hyphomicrobiales bacterium]
MTERTAAADDLFADLPPGEKSRFERIRAELWPKLRRVASRVPFAEDVVAAYYCVLDRDTPTKVRAVLIGALAYFILPADAIPDVLPVVGFTDDAGVIAAALAMVSRHITDRHRDAAKAALERLRT